MSAIDTLSQFVPPDSMRVALRSTPAYVINRNRAAAVLAKGLDAYDAYQTAKPFLFWGSLLGAALSGWAFEMRGRRPKNKEAMVLYGSTFALCAVTAIVTRPKLPEFPADTSPSDAAAINSGVATPQVKKDGALIGWVDNAVAAQQANDPNFADAVFSRLVAMPGISTQFQAMNPTMQAIVL